MHSWASFQINSRPKNIASYDDKKGRLLQMFVIYVLLCILAYVVHMVYNSAGYIYTYLYSKAREAWRGLWESFSKIVQKWKALIGNWMNETMH